jgi:hypothetical protein
LKKAHGGRDRVNFRVLRIYSVIVVGLLGISNCIMSRTVHGLHFIETMLLSKRLRREQVCSGNHKPSNIRYSWVRVLDDEVGQ